jgi:1,2-diacylglycerol 3-alpha-glucosyltransferase
VQLPIQGTLTKALGDFCPHIVHSQHPFLIGDTALRIASKYNVPLVFTHHSLYEENVHYMPGNIEALKRFMIELSTGYANLADHVFAPSESVMPDDERKRGQDKH